MVRSDILIALGVLLIATSALASLNDDTSVGTCMARKLKKCVNSSANRGVFPETLDGTILGALYACVTKLVNNLFSGNLKFPKACCKLPLFNLICNGQRRHGGGRSHHMHHGHF